MGTASKPVRNASAGTAARLRAGHDQRALAPLPALNCAKARDDMNAAGSSEAFGLLSPADMRAMLHELRGHQIELDLRNERLRRMQHHLDAEKSHYSDLYDTAPMGYCTLDADARILQANLTAGSLLGLSHGALALQPLASFVLMEDQGIFCRMRKRLDASGAVQNCELRLMRRDGTSFWAHLAATRVANGEAEPVYRVMLHDITERKRAEICLRASTERLKEAQRLARLGAWELDLVTGKLNWSDEVFHIFEVDPNRFGVFYETFLDAVHPDDRDGVSQAYADSIKHCAPFEVTHRLLTSDGRIKWVHEKGLSECDASRTPLRSWGMIQDITERKQAEDQVRYLAFYDALTGLPNRRLLADRMVQAMAQCKRNGCHGAVILLDLDNFKPLNDRYGHAVGDLLLGAAADRLKACVREMDTVARFGGDEFVVIISELKADHAESTVEATLIAEKIRATLSQPYLLTVKHEGKPVTTVEHRCAASIGVALFVDPETSQDDILKWADTAMYQAKEAGRNAIRHYHPGD